MPLKVVVFAFFAFAAVSGRPSNDFLDCSERPNGIYPDPSNSKAYFICAQKHFLGKFECQEDEIFDASFGNCAKENEEDEKKELADLESDEELDSLKQQLLNLVKQENSSDPEEDERMHSKYKVFNIQVTKNIFPKSIVMIGKANREQKNK